MGQELTPLQPLDVTSCALAAFSCGIFIMQAYGYWNLQDFKTLRLPTILIVLQLSVGFLDHLMMSLQYIVPAIDCLNFGRFQYTLFPLWVTLIEGLLLIRALPFTPQHLQRGLVGFAAVFWILRWVTEIRMISTISVISKPWDYCVFVADFSWTPYNLSIRLLTEIGVLVPFVYRAIENRNSKNRLYYELCVTNSIATLGFILIEIGLNVLVSFTFMFPFLNILFVISDCLEAWICLFVVEDLKSTLNKSQVRITFTADQKMQRTERELPLESREVD